MNSIKRDLTADKAICDAATSGPWEQRRGAIYAGQRELFRREASPRGYGGGDPTTYINNRDANATFAAEARVGWPDAIKRCMAAENAATLLRAQISETTAQMSADIAQLADDNQRLRQQIAEFEAADVQREVDELSSAILASYYD